MNKLPLRFYQLLTTLIFVVFCLNASAQNSTVYAITPSSPYSKFIHFDVITGIITYKSNLGIIEELGTSAFDHEAKNYFIAGYKNTICYLLTIHASSGKIIAEQEIKGNSEWHGFEYDYKTKKIYGTRRDLSTYDFYFATLDPYNKTYAEVYLGKNAASQIGSAMDYNKGLYFFGSAIGFNLSTIDIKTGKEIHTVDYSLPTGSYHFDTVTQELYAIHTSVPRVNRVIMDYENEKHKYDSVPYLRTKSIVSSWYTYDRANHNYLITTDGNTFNMINTQSPKVIFQIEAAGKLKEMEYDSSEPDSAMQVSGMLKSSNGAIQNDAIIYAAVKNASGDFEFNDSTQTNNSGYFTLTTSQKQFYIYIKPDNNSFPEEVPTWYPGTVKANEAKVYTPSGGINLIDISSKHISALSVLDSEALNQVVLYPNPAQNIITIDCKLAIRQLEIIDVLGRIVINEDCKNTEKLTLSLPQNIGSGIYYIKLYSTAGIIIKSFIKQ